MKRLRYCVICEKELEPGGRVDRKYCGVACTQAAYRLRHPEKRRPSPGRVRLHAAGVVGGQRGAGRLADSVAQVEEENASLRRELAALKARTGQQERPSSTTAEVTRQLARERARADQAEATVAELRAELARVQREGQVLEAESAEQQSEVAQLSTDLKVAQDALMAERAKLPRSRAVEGAFSSSRVGSESRQGVTESRKLPSRERASEQTEPDATLQFVAVSADQPSAPLTDTTPRGAQPQAGRAPFPWEKPTANNPSAWIPYWASSGDTIRWLEKEGRAALRSIPTQIYNRGERLKAREMREWIESGPAFIHELAEELAGRIVCTRRSERKSQQQKEQLALLAFRDAVEFLTKKNPEQAVRFERDYAVHEKKYEWMAREFVDAVEDRYFSDR